MTSTSVSLFDSLTAMLATHMYSNQNTNIRSNSIEANYIKSNISLAETQLQLQDCLINVTSFCDLLNSNCSNRIVTQKANRIEKNI